MDLGGASGGEATPAAFYAVRDFELDAVPPGRAAPGPGGRGVRPLASTAAASAPAHYRTGAPLDVYRGRPTCCSRAATACSSSCAAPAAPAASSPGWRTGDGRPLLRTDERWLVFRRHHPGLVRGWLPWLRRPASRPSPGARPPVGRWGAPRPGPPRPLLDDRAPLPAPRPPAPRSGPRDAGRRARNALRLGPRGHRLPAPRAPPGDGAGGRPPLRRRPPARPARRRAGRGAPHAGGRSWLDARPRRFRYVLVLGGRRSSGRGCCRSPARRRRPPRGRSRRREVVRARAAALTNAG